MRRKKAPWMLDVPEPAKRPVVFGVFAWRSDGMYKLENSIRVFKRRHAAECFAEKDETGTWVVREIDAPKI